MLVTEKMLHYHDWWQLEKTGLGKPKGNFTVHVYFEFKGQNHVLIIYFTIYHFSVQRGLNPPITI